VTQTTKWPCDEPKNQIGLTHQAEDRNNYQNFLLFDSHKTIDPTEETPQEGDSQEDSLEVEASLEEEAFQEAEDIQEEEEHRLEDHQEAVGDHRHYPCHKHTKENWWENHPQYTTEIGRKQPSSSTNGSYIGQSITTTPL